MAMAIQFLVLLRDIFNEWTLRTANMNIIGWLTIA